MSTAAKPSGMSCIYILMNTTEQSLQNHGVTNLAVPYDPLLLTVYLLLIGLGTVAVYSATIVHAFSADDLLLFLRRNGINLLFAITVFLFMSSIRVDVWRRYSSWLLLAGFVLLIAVLVPSIGSEINGSRRWISIAGKYFQPSELAEFALLIFIADFLTRNRNRIENFVSSILPIGMVYLVFSTLLILEPDLGSVVVCGATIFAMLYLNGANLKHLAAIMATGVIALAVLIAMEPYRMERLTAFLNPFEDSFDSGFQLVQSLIAFGRGEIFGVGIGNSVQKLFYLPYAESDFLLAIIAEEWGFVGILCVISLFGVLIWRIFYISWLAGQAGDYFAMCLAQGIGLVIAISALVNMGVCMGSLPTKGLTLPFMSDGGTSLIVYSAAIGCVFSIQRHLQYDAERIR